MKKHSFIYRTVCLVNNKVYVGRHETNNLEDGYIGCGISNQSNVTLNTPFHRAVRKYGYENFKREILEDNILTFEELKQREIFWVAELHTQNKEIGYNISSGGDGGWDHWNGTEKHREMCRVGGKKSIEIQKINNRVFGFGEYIRNLTNEQREERRERSIVNFQSSQSKIKRSLKFLEIGHQQGKKNSQFGTRWYVNINTRERKKFKEGNQPKGWITSVEFRSSLKICQIQLPL